MLFVPTIKPQFASLQILLEKIQFSYTAGVANCVIIDQNCKKLHLEKLCACVCLVFSKNIKTNLYLNIYSQISFPEIISIL